MSTCTCVVIQYSYYNVWSKSPVVVACSSISAKRESSVQNCGTVSLREYATFQLVYIMPTVQICKYCLKCCNVLLTARI